MKWYVAEIIVRCRAGGKPRRKEFYDRQIKVLRADTPESAYEHAQQLGKAENHSYKNRDGEQAMWKFIGLANLEELLDDTICDGTEIYSYLEEGDPAAEIRRKEELSVFWFESNKDRTAVEILESREKPFRHGRRGSVQRKS